MNRKNATVGGKIQSFGKCSHKMTDETMANYQFE